MSLQPGVYTIASATNGRLFVGLNETIERDQLPASDGIARAQALITDSPAKWDFQQPEGQGGKYTVMDMSSGLFLGVDNIHHINTDSQLLGVKDNQANQLRWTLNGPSSAGHYQLTYSDFQAKTRAATMINLETLLPLENLLTDAVLGTADSDTQNWIIV